MKETIQKAIEGGWMKKYLKENNWEIDEENNIIYFSDIDCGDIQDEITTFEVLQDKLFWKALGVSLEMTGVVCLTCKDYVPLFGECSCVEYEEEYEPQPQDWWIFAWHKFIDHIADGKDVESFFKELLK